MELTPDQIVYWTYGFVKINATVLFSWSEMLVLAGIAWLSTRWLRPGTDGSRWQHAMEVIVEGLQRQIREATDQDVKQYLPFVGTLFLFIAGANLLAIIPGFDPPTASLSTTAALATCVFVAVPVYGIASNGLKGYLRRYLEPTPFMLPFNIIGELSRTIALAVRLFGNIMSGTLVVAILVSLAPLFFPVVLQAFGLLIGMIQAYVFSILALVYIASGRQMHGRGEDHGHVNLSK